LPGSRAALGDRWTRRAGGGGAYEARLRLPRSWLPAPPGDPGPSRRPDALPWLRPRLQRTWRRRRYGRRPSRRRSKSARRRPGAVSGSASSGRRSCRRRGQAGETSSSAIPTPRPGGPACRWCPGRPPPPRSAWEAPGGAGRGLTRSKGARNRPRSRQIGRSLSRKWCGGGWSTHRPEEGRRRREARLAGV
jgi:hypothetical protein